MKEPIRERSGVLILRLWTEKTHSTGLRARITQMLDMSRREESIAVAASVDDICRVVKQWVDEFAGPRPVAGDSAMIHGATEHES